MRFIGGHRQKMFIDLSGKRFGRLLVVRRVDKPVTSKKRGIYYLCKCDCGTEKILNRNSLQSGTQSCGCLIVETTAQLAKKTLTTHGMAKHPLYHVWHHMMQRCGNPKYREYKLYGARGITVCERWKDVRNFISDMEATYRSGLEIERIDNDKGYEPSNCRWANRKEQCNNTRHNVFFEFNGERKTIAQWAETLGISHQCMNKRLHDWPLERALTAAKLSHSTNYRMIEFNGQTKHLNAWAKELGVHEATLRKRLRIWPVEVALSAPKYSLK